MMLRQPITVYFKSIRELLPKHHDLPAALLALFDGILGKMMFPVRRLSGCWICNF